MAMEPTEFAFPVDAEECEEGYDREYVADDFARYFRAFISSGIIADGGNIAESLQVVANDDMTTTLKAGNLIINGYRYELMKDMVFQHRAADGVLDRIDRISITMDTAEREIHAILREGEYSYKPVAPQCRRSSEYMDYVVADVRIVKGAIKITQANITDTRLSTELCGIAFPFWKLDTGPFFAQLDSFYNEFVLKSDRSYDEFLAWTEEKKAEIVTWQGKEEAEVDAWQSKKIEEFVEWAEDFINKWESWLLGETKGWQEEIIDWFDNLKEKLSENAAIQLQLQIGDLNQLKTDEKEDLVSAINSLCLSYEETLEILGEGVKTLTVMLSTNDGASVTGQTVTLLNVVTGEEITKEYDAEEIAIEVYGEMPYRLCVSDMENYVTPDPVEIYITDGETLDVDLVYYTTMLNYYTWKEIAAIAESGKASHIFKIGDTKDFTLTTGENLKAVILDFNHDPLASDTTNTAGITFSMLNCLGDRYRMNSIDASTRGYEESEMFSTITTEFYDKLPKDMKTYIKRVRKKGYVGNESSTIKSFDTFAFLLAEVEISRITEHSFDGEGTLYPYFATEANRIKNNEQGELVNWWLRSPAKYDGTSFCFIDRRGNTFTNLASATLCAILAGFCM